MRGGPGRELRALVAIWERRPGLLAPGPLAGAGAIGPGRDPAAAIRREKLDQPLASAAILGKVGRVVTRDAGRTSCGPIG
jgi:hypothetical protein